MAKKVPGGRAVAIPAEVIERKIYLIGGLKVMLDRDLAYIYGVETRALVQAVTRNAERFPADFMFQLSKEELDDWRSQFVMSNPEAKMGLRRPPYAFTELGVAMLSSVLKSGRAVRMNIMIMRAFVRLREMLATHQDLARAIEDIGRRQEEHGEQITSIIETINQLLLPEPVSEKRRIGFHPGEQPKHR
ncbi:MAG TPA: DNA-binding protein [Solibacterales bacterium]|nr:DNA-binding protein [Bryobacterales bacterium]